jgi:hypothetical protein
MSGTRLYLTWLSVWAILLSLLYGVSLQVTPWPPILAIWLLLAALSLAVSAWDIVVLLVGAGALGVAAQPDPVPAILTPAEAARAEAAAARLAILIPAGHEATTRRDREQFFRRLVHDILPFIPPQATVFLLFDTGGKPACADAPGPDSAVAAAACIEGCGAYTICPIRASATGGFGPLCWPIWLPPGLRAPASCRSSSPGSPGRCAPRMAAWPCGLAGMRQRSAGTASGVVTFRCPGPAVLRAAVSYPSPSPFGRRRRVPLSPA